MSCGMPDWCKVISFEINIPDMVHSLTQWNSVVSDHSYFSCIGPDNISAYVVPASSMVHAYSSDSK